MIELRSVSIRSGCFRLTDLQLRVGSGEYVVLMGKSGAGKTTILEAICGLRRIESGSIYVEETDVTVVHVTHHAQEALALADRILRLEQGRLE